jgi:magnesium transporter
MLTLHGNSVSERDTAAEAVDDSAVWFDLVDPTDAECRRVERATGIALPDRERIGSIELSRRAIRDGDALCLNMPFFTNSDAAPTPAGLILTSRHLVSVRYTESAAFERAAATVRALPQANSAIVFATLAETIVGDIADRMEDTAAEVGRLSTRLFGERRRKKDGALRTILGEVGRAEARLTRARLTSTGLLRIVMFAHDNPPGWIAKAELLRLRSAQKDLEVLGELDTQLTDKLQFLLDAALGFISIDQNDVMKVFTVASVAAIPPMLLVGIWGMNFQHMPELSLAHGYPLALGVIALSIGVPLLWFRRRGWI